MLQAAAGLTGSREHRGNFRCRWFHHLPLSEVFFSEAGA